MKGTEGVGGWFFSAPETCLVKKHYTQCDLAMSDLLKLEVAPRFSPIFRKMVRHKWQQNFQRKSNPQSANQKLRSQIPLPHLRNLPQTYRNTVIPIKPCGGEFHRRRGKNFTNLAESLPIQILQVFEVQVFKVGNSVTECQKCKQTWNTSACDVILMEKTWNISAW